MGYVVNLDVQGRPALVVGAGSVAGRKIAALADAGAAVTVIAPEIGDAVIQLERDGRIEVVRRRFEPGDARGAFLVVGATDDDDVNRQVAKDARVWGALVNIVDRPALCTYTVPAVVRRGLLTVAVATDGQCPSLARVLRERLERQFGPEYEQAVERLGRLRERLMDAGWDSARIRRSISTLIDAGFVEAIASGDEARAGDLMTALLDEAGAAE
ncbi:MAG: bifunctional precorrin-2 dehydrogenase/sirohydrochlorin ferrochelatase [Acidobacteriota bacterium]